VPKVIADISMSLDGFVTGPGADQEHGLGHGGEPLHTWALASDDPVDAEVLRAATEGTGAVVMGRRLYDVVGGPQGWNDEMGYGAQHAATPPFFVVTHAAPDDVRPDLEFTFVTDGLEAAVERAKAAAGDLDVVVMGGGDVIRQAIESGLADELRIHLAPVILGGGTPLFGSTRTELTPTSSVASKHATHLTYALR